MIEFETSVNMTKWQLIRYMVWMKIRHPFRVKLTITRRKMMDEYSECVVTTVNMQHRVLP